jgi:hypothetical protein
MDKPTIFEPYQAGPDIDVVPAYFPIPSMGFLAVDFLQVFLYHASQRIDCLCDRVVYASGFGTGIPGTDLSYTQLNITNKFILK